jgi:hypothetical protein
MKTALLPATRVTTALRKRVESLLDDGETISGFIEAAVTQHADARAARRSLVKRSFAAEQALSANMSETATPVQFTVEGDGVVAHVSVYQS